MKYINYRCRIHLDHSVQGDRRVHIRETETPIHVQRRSRSPGSVFCERNSTLFLLSLSFFPSNIEKGPSLRREVYSVAELRVKKMSRVLVLAALTTLLLVAILSVGIGDCKSVRDWYVICGRLSSLEF